MGNPRNRAARGLPVISPKAEFLMKSPVVPRHHSGQRENFSCCQGKCHFFQRWDDGGNPTGFASFPCPRAAGFALGVQGVGPQGAGLKLLPPRSTLQDAAPLQGVFAPQERSRPSTCKTSREAAADNGLIASCWQFARCLSNESLETNKK